MNMQKTGQITHIVKKGGYPSQGGYIHTFNMTVQFPDGEDTGEIGSKSEQYPMQRGDEITVEISDTQYGRRFKKVNPGYQQGPSHSAQSQNSDPARDLSIKRGNALNAVMSATQIPSDKVGEYLVASMGWLNNGVWKLLPSGLGKQALPELPPELQDQADEVY
jgi:hypothetical protein